MPATAHTQEPWYRALNPTMIGHRGLLGTYQVVAHVEIRRGHTEEGHEHGSPKESIEQAEAFANATRIVECVNNCAGINPDAVPALLEALKDILSVVLATGGLDSGFMSDSNLITKAQAAITKATEKRV